MGLPSPAPRRHLHTRSILCEGFLRDDGLYDIEARIVDTKTYEAEEPFRGLRPAGAHVHDMSLRLTLDTAMVVRDIAVSTEHAPYDPCFTVAPAFRALVGTPIGAGWRKAVNAAVGGVKGCTHLKELLMPVATVAYQTMSGWPRPREGAVGLKPLAKTDASPARPYFLDGCKAWDAGSEVTRRLYPLYYKPSR